MKILIPFLALSILLSGCGLNEQSAKTTPDKEYRNEQSGISFTYPADWELIEDKDGVTVIDQTTETSLTLPGESFDEFEQRNGEYLADNKISRLGDAEKFPTELSERYAVRGYESHEGMHFILKINEDFVNISSGSDLSNAYGEEIHPETQKAREGLDLILSTLTM